MKNAKTKNNGSIVLTSFIFCIIWSRLVNVRYNGGQDQSCKDCSGGPESPVQCTGNYSSFIIDETFCEIFISNLKEKKFKPSRFFGVFFLHSCLLDFLCFAVCARMS